MDGLIRATEHHQESPHLKHKRSHSGGIVAAASPSDAFSGGAFASTSAGGHPPAQKRKITRKRAVLSCRSCTSRKIRCEREGGPGTACKACEKRGEANLCDAGSQPSSSGTPLVLPIHNNVACSDHRSDLERRLSHLESIVLSNRCSRSIASSSGEAPLAVQEGPDSETEDAAMTLEDIAVNVRIASTSTARRGGPASAPPTPYLPPSSLGQTREMTSLLVPEPTRRYRGVLEDLYATLPEKSKADWLVAHYVASLSWFWIAHHLPTFVGEYEAFHRLLKEGRQREVDPLWLAILFLTLAHAANSLDWLPPGCPFTPEELATLTPSYFEAARAALDCGDALGSARLRTVQAVVLLAPLSLNSGNPARVDILIPYVAAAVRLCQHLKLDKLGNDPAAMPPEDPSLPSGTNTLRRERAIQLFHALLHVDQVTFRCRPVLPLHLVECALPGNYEDKDLSPTSLTAPQPRSTRTITAYETLRFRVGAVQRAFHENVILDPGFAYTSVLKHDTEMRNLLTEYDLERPEPNETTAQFWARVFSLQNINIRLIRFHRPFMSRGYREATYRKSTDAALAAARVVLETQKELDRTNAPLVKDCYQLNHIQVAIVCLFLDMWQNSAAQPGAPEATSDYRLISEASLVFHRALGSLRERVRAVARQSLLVIQCLFEALAARSATGRRESFAQLLKRVSVAVAEMERRAAASLKDSASSTLAANSAVPPPASGPHPNAAAIPSFYNGQVPLPPADPVSGDDRSLLLDVSTPGFDARAPAFVAAPASAHGSANSFSPNELHFGDLTSEWGFSWLQNVEGGYA
ncbi:hypothetical protein JCM11251_007684 [Rhodosporidiobolus azoricus]